MEEILPHVIKVILANHYPAIAAIFPHGTSFSLRGPGSANGAAILLNPNSHVNSAGAAELAAAVI
jgi:hypothetical protein